MATTLSARHPYAHETCFEQSGIRRSWNRVTRNARTFTWFVVGLLLLTLVGTLVLDATAG